MSKVLAYLWSLSLQSPVKSATGQPTGRWEAEDSLLTWATESAICNSQQGTLPQRKQKAGSTPEVVEVVLWLRPELQVCLAQAHHFLNDELKCPVLQRKDL